MEECGVITTADLLLIFGPRVSANLRVKGTHQRERRSLIWYYIIIIIITSDHSSTLPGEDARIIITEKPLQYFAWREANIFIIMSWGQHHLTLFLSRRRKLRDSGGGTDDGRLDSKGQQPSHFQECCYVRWRAKGSSPPICRSAAVTSEGSQVKSDWITTCGKGGLFIIIVLLQAPAPVLCLGGAHIIIT
jgi:hypothetical protein